MDFEMFGKCLFKKCFMTKTKLLAWLSSFPIFLGGRGKEMGAPMPLSYPREISFLLTNYGIMDTSQKSNGRSLLLTVCS